MGDFFEMFYEDAEKAAPILNIALTARNKKASDEVKMCGVPHHSVAGPIGKLLAEGLKVAICDQVEPVSQAKGLVKRAVTRILTPGMVYDPESLDQLSAHYLCAFDESAVSFTDISTGEAFYYLSTDKKVKWRIIRLLNPVELILTPEQKETVFSKKEWEAFHVTVFEEKQNAGISACYFSHLKSAVVTPSPEDATSLKELSVSQKQEFPPYTDENLLKTVSIRKQKSTLPSYAKSSLSIPESAKRLLNYIMAQQGKEVLTVIQPFQERNVGQEMWFSSQAQEHLELFKTYDGDKKGSLFSAVNRAKTPPGARLLKSRLRNPSTNQKEIEERIKAVGQWIERADKIEKIRNLLFHIGDIERKLGKISHPQCNGRDLLTVAESLRIGLELISLDQSLCVSSVALDSARELINEIGNTIRPDAPVGTQTGNMIQKGVSEELDHLIEEAEKRQSSLRRLEERERVQTGIPSLKIRYNNIFGYYIEVTKTHSKKTPAHYIRKQTLTQAERYTTEQLQKIEAKILSSRALRIEMEFRVFEDLRQKVMGALSDLFHLSRIICEMDLNVAFAYLAIEQSYVRPCLSSDNQMVLVNSRHPVVEQNQNQHFIPNTIRMKSGECLLLTGPNMAGKSTLMRQVALSVILAQAGCFVPAEQALLPVFTRIFTRIGASDSLSQGLSTFMVEMKESVEILKQANENSLIVLDEIGRGTSTYDGMSLAQAILEFLIEKKKSLVFFATHYHELTTLAKVFPKIRNAHLSVSEKSGQINFLYTLVPGALAQSYGVHVARLAGFPLEVVERAEALLRARESSSVLNAHRASQKSKNVLIEDSPTGSSSGTDSSSRPSHSLSEKEKIRSLLLKKLAQEIKSYPLQEKSPLETMNAVAGWKKEITEKS